MTSYRRFVPPPAPTGGAVDSAGFALRMFQRLRMDAKGRPKELVDREDEGGSLAAPAIATPSS